MVGEWPFQCPLGPLGVSSTSSGPKLNRLEMQEGTRQTRNPQVQSVDF